MQAISIESDCPISLEPFKSLKQRELKTSTSSGSYDENDFENYIEDRQQCLRGDEPNPEFTNHHVFGKPKRKEKSLKEDLIRAEFPPDIVAKADEVFIDMNSGLKRGVRRKQLMFFCVQTAYNLLGIAEDPATLANRCGITPSEMMKASSMCSYSKTNYKPPPIHWSAKDYLKVFFQKIVDMDIISFSDDTLKEIENICDEVLGKSFELRDEKPQTVAAAVIVFYLGLHGCAIDKRKYTEIFSRSNMTIHKTAAKVDLIYNS
jgi:hypothetical protein